MSKTLQAIKLRNDFYRDNFRRVVFILLLSVILNIILIASLFFLSAKPTKVVYFASDSQGKLIKMQPLSQPVMSATALQSWVSRNVPKIYSLDYVHYRTQLNNIRKYFTAFGWNNFRQTFQPVLQKILSQQYVVSAAITDVPYISEHATLNGVYSWKVQVPIKITFRKGNTATTSNDIMQLVIQRVNNATSDQLVGISQIVQTAVKDNQ